MVMCTHLHVDHVGWNTPPDNGKLGADSSGTPQVRIQQGRLRPLPEGRRRSRSPANTAASFRDSRAAGGRGQADADGRRRRGLGEHLWRSWAPAIPLARSPSGSKSRGAKGVLRRHPQHACRSIIRSGTASPVPMRSRTRARAGARRPWRTAPAQCARLMPCHFRRTVHLPHRPRGRRLRAAISTPDSSPVKTRRGIDDLRTA